MKETIHIPSMDGPLAKHRKDEISMKHNESDLLTAAANSLGYLWLKSFQYEEGYLKSHELCKVISEEIFNFFQFLEQYLEKNKMPRHVFEGLSYEIFDGPYDKKEIKDFSEWIKTSWGLEKISDIYNQLSEELE